MDQCNQHRQIDRRRWRTDPGGLWGVLRRWGLIEGGSGGSGGGDFGEDVFGLLGPDIAVRFGIVVGDELFDRFDELRDATACYSTNDLFI